VIRVGDLRASGVPAWFDVRCFMCHHFPGASRRPPCTRFGSSEITVFHVVGRVPGGIPDLGIPPAGRARLTARRFCPGTSPGWSSARSSLQRATG